MVSVLRKVVGKNFFVSSEPVVFSIRQLWDPVRQEIETQ